MSIPALRQVDLEVPAGSIHGIIGPNGSGKTTLLRILATTVLPDSGSALVCQHDVVRQARLVRRAIGLSTGEERSLYWRLSARHNLEFAAALQGIAQPDRAISSALQLVGLQDDADRPVSGYSQGMARRLGLARALLHRPAVLLLDEPTRSLDPAATRHLHQVLGQIREDRGVTTIMTTHDLEEAAAVCDQVSGLRLGQISGHVTPSAESRPHAALERLLS
jgi:ABC-2 type transport system ATP-binding protein